MYLQWDQVDGFNPGNLDEANAYLEKENFYGDGEEEEFENYSDYCDHLLGIGWRCRTLPRNSGFPF